LSVMMVLSLVAPTGAQAAAKYSLTQKSGLSTLKADKAYTYVVKGVKKTQYIKVSKTYKDVVVKKGSTTVKKATKIKGTGKTINLKVTCPDKVANYKNTLKVKVYNKKNNKLVKTLSKKATVKVVELKVTKVETASTTGKYLVAYFNKALASLKVADVTVREKDTNVMKGVESVALASDGKSATIALVGDETKGANSFVQMNRTYTFAVSQKGVTATTEFTVDAYAENVVVEGTDAEKKTITVGNVTYTVAEGVAVDYEEILGRTVTFWYDKDMNVKKINVNNETVLYSAFALCIDSTGAYLYDYATDKKHYTQDTEVLGNTSSTIGTSNIVVKGKNNTETYYSFNQKAHTYPTFKDGQNLDYAKVILNTNGTVKTVVTVEAWTGNILVEKMNGTVAFAGTSEQNFKGYTVIKDGKTSTVEAIQAGDVVFYNTTLKVAEIYDEKTTAPLNAIYDTKVTVGTETLEWKYATTTEAFNSKYVDSKNGIVDVTVPYLKALKAAGKDVTVYFDRYGDPVYIIGELGQVATTNADMVLTQNTAVDNSAFKNIVRYTGFIGDKIQNVDVDLSKVKAINTIKIGEPAAVVGFKVDDNGDIVAVDKNGNVVASTTATTTAKADKNTLVILTRDAEGNVVGINNTATHAGYNKTSSTGNKDSFEAGMKVINGYQVQPSVPVYIFNKSNEATVKVTKTTYGEFKNVVATREIDDQHTTKGAADYVVVYKEAEKNDVHAIVILPDGIGDDSNDSVKVKAVVSNYKTLDQKLVELTVVCGKETKTYTKFGESFAQGVLTTYDTGKVVTLTLNKEQDTVLAAAPGTFENAAAMTDVKVGQKTFNYTTPWRLPADVVPTIVKVNDYGTAVDVIEFSALVELCAKYDIMISKLDNTTDVADVIVVTTTPLGKATDDAAIAADVEEVTTLLTQTNMTTAQIDLSEKATVSKVELTGEGTGVTVSGKTISFIVANEGSNKITVTFAKGNGDTVKKTFVITIAGGKWSGTPEP
jgi:hypothetical protein